MGRKFVQGKPVAFTLHIQWYRGGRTRRKSRDWKGEKHQPWFGLTDLEAYILKNSQHIKSAKIFDHRGKGKKLIREFKNGLWPVVKPVEFD